MPLAYLRLWYRKFDKLYREAVKVRRALWLYALFWRREAEFRDGMMLLYQTFLFYNGKVLF